jgi:hypothetical protein
MKLKVPIENAPAVTFQVRIITGAGIASPIGL